MTGHGAKFPRKKEEAIAALLTRPSVEEAARTIEVEPKTLRRWMRVPEFQAAASANSLPIMCINGPFLRTPFGFPTFSDS